MAVAVIVLNKVSNTPCDSVATLFRDQTLMSTLPDNKEGYTMADQTSNEISHVQSVNRGRELQRGKIKTNLSAETQATLQKNTEELGVDVVKKQISIFFKTPFDQLKKL